MWAAVKSIRSADQHPVLAFGRARRARGSPRQLMARDTDSNSAGRGRDRAGFAEPASGRWGWQRARRQLGLALRQGPLAFGFPLLHRRRTRRCGRGGRRRGQRNIGFPGEAAQPGQPDGIGVEVHVACAAGRWYRSPNFCLRCPIRSPSINPRSTMRTLIKPLCTARTTSSTSS